MLDKIENFLFDVLGLFVPGLIFWLLVIILPVLVINSSQLASVEYLPKALLSLAQFIVDNFNQLKSPASFWFFAIIVLICYLSGTTIKVFAKYQYEICELVFDRAINKLFTRLFQSANHKVRSIFADFINNIKQKYLRLIIDAISKFCQSFLSYSLKIIKDIFGFKPPDYYCVNEPIKAEVINMINQKYQMEFPNEWHSVYKLSNTIMLQASLKSLVPQFLAKYNFYRSVAFIFLLNLFYILWFFYLFDNQIGSLGHSLYQIILCFNCILWSTFHIKYKRYWTLCGNESLMSIFYFLKKS